MSSSLLWCEERYWDGNPRSPYFLPFSLSLGVGIFLFHFRSLRGFVPPLLRLDDPLLLDHLFSLFSVVARCVPDLTGEFFLELLPYLSFESRLSFEEPPRFLFHLLETLFIFGACFPVVSTSLQLLTLLTHRSFIFPCCFDEEVECLVSRPPRNPPARLKKLLPVGRSGLANGECCIISAWGCEPPAPMLGAVICSAGSSRSPGG